MSKSYFLDWSRVFAIQNEVLSKTTSDATLKEVLNDLTDRLDELNDEQAVTILKMSDEGLRPFAGARIPKAWTDLIDPLALGENKGSCGTAGYFKKTVICENLMQDPRWAAYREYQPLHGFMACWSQPILDQENQLLGTFAVYFKSPRSPNNSELILIQSLANTVRVIMERDHHKQELVDARNRAEAQYRSIFENSIEGIFQVTLDGHILILNPAFAHILGCNTVLEAMDYMQQDARGFLLLAAHPEEIISRIKQDGHIIDFETKLARKDGTFSIVSITAHAVYGDNEEITCIEGTIEDVTEKKQAEAEKKDFENRLNQAKKLEALGTLTGGIAHDFNNMLGGIIGATELLEDYMPDDPNADKYYNIIKKTVQRASELTAQLQTFSRRNDKVTIVTDIHQNLTDTITLLQRTIDKRISFNIDLSAKQSNIVGDPSLLENMFLNLCINASHAMPEGGELSITTKTVELDSFYCKSSPFEIEPGLYLEVQIRDTGFGIPHEHLSKIFDPFFTTKKQSEGTGLGLASVYGATQQHEGAITVYSEEGVGTVFHILLPVATGNQKPASKEPGIMQKGTGCILVIDDEEVMRITAQAILKKLGYNVLLAEDGRDGLEKYRQTEGIDLVILDMTMPVMNGRDCFVQLQALNPDVKVILSSGFTQEKDLMEMQKMGLLGFIRKPYLSSELSIIVHNALAKSFG